jgi:hypothetical protein
VLGGCLDLSATRSFILTLPELHLVKVKNNPIPTFSVLTISQRRD